MSKLREGHALHKALTNLLNEFIDAHDRKRNPDMLVDLLACFSIAATQIASDVDPEFRIRLASALLDRELDIDD